MNGLNAAIISAGCIIGAPVVGHLVDRWGRKAGLGLGAMSIITGVVLQASATKGECAMLDSFSPGPSLTHMFLSGTARLRSLSHRLCYLDQRFCAAHVDYGVGSAQV